MALHGTSAAFEPAAVERSALRQTIADRAHETGNQFPDCDR